MHHIKKKGHCEPPARVINIYAVLQEWPNISVGTIFLLQYCKYLSFFIDYLKAYLQKLLLHDGVVKSPILKENGFRLIVKRKITATIAIKNCCILT